jgi:hypothetical protein
MSNLNPTDDYTFSGRVRFRQAPTFPNDAIPSAAIDGPIDAVKLEGEHNFTLSQSGDVVAAAEYLRVIFGATGVVIAMEAAITETIATGPDRTVTVDLLKSSGGGAFTSILAAPLTFNSTSTLRALASAAFSNPALADGDILKLTVAVAGAAGAQAQGLVCSVTIREDAE